MVEIGWAGWLRRPDLGKKDGEECLWCGDWEENKEMMGFYFCLHY